MTDIFTYYIGHLRITSEGGAAFGNIAFYGGGIQLPTGTEVYLEGWVGPPTSAIAFLEGGW